MMNDKTKWQWKMHNSRPPVSYKLTRKGHEPIHIVADKSGCFEIDGPTDYPILCFASRILLGKSSL